MEQFKDAYEISLWGDVYKNAEGAIPAHYEEEKIGVIGSDSMTAQWRAVEPKLTQNVNGTNTFTFKMFYTYIDTITGERKDNPFQNLLVNERKVKVKWKDKWYDFVIKNCQEDSSGKSITYTCQDQFINELSKTGFNLEFDNELGNNMGTVQELAEKVLAGTDWTVGTSDIIKQYREEPVYDVTYTWTDEQQATHSIRFLVFYSVVQNKETYFQYWYDSTNTYTKDGTSLLVISGECKSATATWVDETATVTIEGVPTEIDFSDRTVSNNYRAKRLIRSQDSAFCKSLNRYVDKYSYFVVTSDITPQTGKTYYKIVDNQYVESTDNQFQSGTTYYEKKYAYGYETTVYNDITAIQNYIQNSEGFTSTENWTDAGGQIAFKLIGEEENLKSYLFIPGATTAINIYNSGIYDYRSQLKAGFIKGEKYIVRLKAKRKDNNNNYIDIDGSTDDNSIKVTPFIGTYNPTDYSVITSYFDSSTATYKEEYIVTSDTTRQEKNYYLKEEDGTYVLYLDNDFTNNIVYEKSGFYWAEFVLTCTKSATYDLISSISSDLRFGFMLKSNAPRYIETIQLFKYTVNDYDAILYPGSFDTESVVKTEWRYFTEESLNLTDAGRINYISYSENPDSTYTAVYPTDEHANEKVRSISGKNSNRFNWLQTLAETFECWVKFNIEHNSDGTIKYENNIPQKKIHFVEQVGEETGLSFVYGIDLNTISRTINSDQIATKVIVSPNSNEFGQDGFCTIARSDENYPKANFILNFDYFIQKGMLDRAAVDLDLYNSAGTVFLPRISRQSYQNEGGGRYYVILGQTEAANVKRSFHLAANTQYSFVVKVNTQDVELGFRRSPTATTGGFSTPINIEKEQTSDGYYLIKGIIDTNADYEDNHHNMHYGANELYYAIWVRAKENGVKLTPADVASFSLINITGGIGYYFNLRENNTKYDEVAEELSDINTELTRYKAELDRYSKLQLSSETELTNTRTYILNYLKYNPPWNATKEAKVKQFITNNPTNTIIPSKYATEVTLVQDIESYKKIIKTLSEKVQDLEQQVTSLKAEQDFYQGQIEALDSAFYKKYSRYIQEGSWMSEDYYDDNLYYLDAESVAYTSSRPQIQYNINVLRLSALDEFKHKIFNVGDRCYIQDVEFFGYQDDKITPYKEEILVSEITSVFDSPEQDTITVQNYKTQFEDLFQRITAATQALQYSEGGYAKAAAIVTSTGEINSWTLEKSFAYNENLAWTAKDDSVIINSTGITATDMSNPSNMVRLSSVGIQISNDGGFTWTTGISGEGISTQNLTAGNINVDNIQILSGSYPTFQWNKYGLNAYYFTTSGNEITNVWSNKFVRFDRFGIYGIQAANGSDVETVYNSEDDVWAAAQYALTWKGFMLKTDGGAVTITSQDDIQVWDDQSTPVNRIKIGRIGGQGTVGDPYVYGIRINNASGTSVMESDSDGKLWVRDKLYIGTNNSNYDVGIGNLGIASGETLSQVINANDNFIVYEDGSIIANNGTFKGRIEASEGIFTGELRGATGTFTGTITATGGTIGGVSIESISDSTYSVSITSSNGTTFKNGLGSTTLTAVVRQGARIISTGNTYQWYKDNVVISGETGQTLTVDANNVSTTAQYKCVVTRS